MARVSATASLGIRRTLGHKKGWGSHDAASPHHSFTIEREFSEELTDEELETKALGLNAICEKMVQNKINDEIKRIEAMP